MCAAGRDVTALGAPVDGAYDQARERVTAVIERLEPLAHKVPQGWVVGPGELRLGRFEQFG